MYVISGPKTKHDSDERWMQCNTMYDARMRCDAHSPKVNAKVRVKVASSQVSQVLSPQVTIKQGGADQD